MTALAGPLVDLSVDGTVESAWAVVLDRLPSFQPPAAARLVVVSPHPDDETLGAGGLITMTARRRLPVDVVVVTDGEAAFPHHDLGAWRRRELAEALDVLAPRARAHHLGLPDGNVSGTQAALRAQLVRMIGPSDLVVCPLPDDGHPDHEATAAATIDVALAAGAAVRCFPIWAWHWQGPATSQIARGERLDLPRAVRTRKQTAIACYQSQLDGLAPVVPPAMMRRLDRVFETYVRPPGSPR